MAPDSRRPIEVKIRELLVQLLTQDVEGAARAVDAVTVFGGDAAEPLSGLLVEEFPAGRLKPVLLRPICEALAGCGPDGVAALEEIIRAGGADEVREEALAALRLLGGAPDGVFARALRWERRAAVRECAVRRCGDGPAFRDLLTERAMTDRAAAVRMASCDALVALEPYRHASAVLVEVRPLMLRIGAEGSHLDARCRALEHLGRGNVDLNDQDQVVQLLDLAADDPAEEIRRAATLALRRNDADEPPGSRRLLVATIASAWEERYDRVARRIDVLRELKFRPASLNSRIFGREAGTDLAVSLLPMLLSQVEEERRAAAWFLFDVCVGIWVPWDYRDSILDRLATLAAADASPPWGPRDVRDLFLAHANRDPQAERALHVMLALFDDAGGSPHADFLSSWRWTLADSPRPIGWMVVGGAIVHAQRREELRDPTRGFLREVAHRRPDLAHIAQLGLEAMGSGETESEYDPEDVRHGLAAAEPAERAERLFRWGHGLPGRNLTRRQWATVGDAISPGAAGDRILARLGRVRTRADAIRLLRHAERIVARTRRGSGPGRPRSSELMREYRAWLDDDLDWEAWVQREREEALQEQLAEQRSYSWAPPSSLLTRDHANLGQQLMTLPRRLGAQAEDTRLRDVPGAHDFLRDWRGQPQWEPRLPDDPELSPAVRQLLRRSVDEPLTAASEMEALAWLESEGEAAPWGVSTAVVADLLEVMRPSPRSEQHQRRIYKAVTGHLADLLDTERQRILRSLHRLHPEWIPLALHLASGATELAPAFRQAVEATHGSVLALELIRLSDLDRFVAVVQESWEGVVDAARRALADQEPENEEDEFDPAEHLDAQLEEWLQNFAGDISRSASPLLWAGAGSIWGVEYPSFELVSRPTVSTVHPDVVAEAVALCEEMDGLASDVERDVSGDRFARIEGLFADRPGEPAPSPHAPHIGGVQALLTPFVVRLDEGRVLVDEGTEVPDVGILTNWPDAPQVLADIGRHLIAYVALRKEVLPSDVVRIRARHIRRFWHRVEELDFRPPGDCPDAVRRWGLDAVLEGLAHALLHQAQQRRDEPPGDHAFRREMWHYCVRLIALIRGLQPQPELRMQILREFGSVGSVDDGDGGYVDVDGLARAAVDHLSRRILGGPEELCQALGLPAQGLPRLTGGRLTHTERRFGALRRRLSLGSGESSEDEGIRFECRPLPKALALMRGALGGDCSSATIPLRALLPHYTYYGIFRDGEQQRGYMTVVEAWAQTHEDGEVLRVLCLETINVPIRAFDAVQQDLLLLFDSIARSRGLDGLVMIHDASTWNYSNEEAIQSTRRVIEGGLVNIEPADPAVFAAYELLAPREAGTYCPFRSGLDFTLLDPFDPEQDRVQPENLAESARLGSLAPHTPIETCWSGGEAVGFISAWPRPDPE